MEETRARRTGLVSGITQGNALWQPRFPYPPQMARLLVRKLLRHRSLAVFRHCPAPGVHASPTAPRAAGAMVSRHLSGTPNTDIIEIGDGLAQANPSSSMGGRRGRVPPMDRLLEHSRSRLRAPLSQSGS